MSCRLWDLRMEGHAVRTMLVHEHLRPFLNELYEADAMCDKFGLGCSHDGKKFVTGSYKSVYRVLSRRVVSFALVLLIALRSCVAALLLLLPLPLLTLPPPSSSLPPPFAAINSLSRTARARR